MTRALVIAVLAAVIGSVTAAFVAATTMLVGRTAIESDDEPGFNAVFEEDPRPSTQHDARGFFAPRSDGG